MKDKTIFIAGASGHMGKRIVQQLSNTGMNLVLLSSRGEVPYPVNKNVTVIKADISNREEIIRLTKSATALFWMVPGNINYLSMKDWYKEVIEAGVEASKNNSIQKVVLLSSLGAGCFHTDSTVRYVAEMEKAFYNAVPNVVALRPGYFMENFLLQQEDILNKGYFSFPYSEEHDIPLISTDDIGDEAANYLKSDDWSGQWIKNLMGAKNLTMPKAAQILSARLKKEVNYNKISLTAIQEQFAAMNASKTTQQEMVELFKTLGDPNGPYGMPRTFDTVTPTRFETFVKTKIA